MDYSQISGAKAPKYALLAVAALAAGLFFTTPGLKAAQIQLQHQLPLRH